MSLPALASFLDPRFKQLKFVAQPEKKAAVHDAVVSLMQNFLKSAPATSELESQKCSQWENDGHPPAKKKCTWDIIGIITSSTQTQEAAASDNETEEEELHRYCAAEPLTLSGDPLVWWKKKEVQYRRLTGVS